LVGEVGAVVGEAGVGGEEPEARLLEDGVVVVLDVVEAVDGLAVAKEAVGDMKADEAGAAGDEDQR